MMNQGIVQRTKITLEMIKIEHTLFALPFALLGAVLASGGIPDDVVLVWILLAMVGARSAAMAFNRLVDRKYDAANPRTQKRALPAGLVSAGFVRLFVILSSAVFFLAAAMLNQLTLLLSPVALGSILVYSYTKRFTTYSHLILGWCLAIAPTGAWIAVRGAIDSVVPLLLSLGVMMWTAGFDILYACQDVEFDQRAGLHSMPRRIGINAALWVARFLHFVTFGSFLTVAWMANMHVLGFLGVAFATTLLIRQHWLVKPNDLSRLNEAFFTTNAYISVVLLLTMGGDVLLADWLSRS
jgi:4-hydroxybenzoate polyprenyltransferase